MLVQEKRNKENTDETSEAKLIVQLTTKIIIESIMKFPHKIETYPTIEDIRNLNEEEVPGLLQ